MNIRTLIIDDEPHAREGIRLRLGKYPEIEILGECSSGSEAVQAINSLKPDLLYLDIQMPGMNGFEVLREIDIEPMPLIIFVTAYDKYALNAFEFHAFDYLLKPINDDRFNDTIKLILTKNYTKGMENYAVKLKALVTEYLDSFDSESDEEQIDLVENRKNFLDRLLIKSKEGITIIPVIDIIWLESAGDYVYVHTISKKLIFRETLSALELKLDPQKFSRIHRSVIVNINEIKNLRPNEHGDYDVYLNNGTKLKLSRTYKASFQKAIGNTL